MQLNNSLEKVYENIEIAKGVYKLTIKGSFKGKPGQFYMLRAWDKEPLLSRPISIYDIDKEKISFVYQVVGKGTKFFSNLKRGDEIKITGPLGNGFPVDLIRGKVAFVTGGIGIAPLNYLAKQIKSTEIDLYCGFKSETYIIDEISRCVQNIYIATEDGNSGTKAYVTDIFKPEKYDMVISCGPQIMMEKVIKMCNEKNIPVYVSMEKHMACGIGACLVCTCKTKSGNKRTCKDGPVFLGSEVIIDD